MARSGTDLPMANAGVPHPPPREHAAVRTRPAAERKPRGKPPQIMRQYDLIERVRRYNPNTDEALLNRAYVYAMKAHGEQTRASGDPISPIRSKLRRS